MTLSDLSGLVGGAIVESSSSNDAPPPEKRRRYLRRADHVCVKGIDPSMRSALADANLEEVWTSICEGDKYCSFYSEFCDNDVYRRGVAISRTVESLMLLESFLSDSHVAMVVEKVVLQKAKTEFETYLKPFISVLNGGKASLSKKNTLFGGGGARMKAIDGQAVERAVDGFYKWLKNENSILRSVLYVVSFGAVPWVAYVAEKVARAAADDKGGKLSREDFIRAAQARPCGPVRAEVDEVHRNAYNLSSLLKPD